MRTAVKLSEDLVNDARDEAKAADRSIQSQIEHWARLGRTVEGLLRHEEVVALKLAAGETDDRLIPAARRTIVATLRRIASEETRLALSSSLMKGRTVYQDAGNGLIERIDRDGNRRVGRLLDRRFTPEEPQAGNRRK